MSTPFGEDAVRALNERTLCTLAEHVPHAVATEFPRAVTGAVALTNDAVCVLLIDQAGVAREFAFPLPNFAMPDELLGAMAVQRASEMMLAGFN